jgi:hypothetical protein
MQRLPRATAACVCFDPTPLKRVAGILCCADRATFPFRKRSGRSISLAHFSAAVPTQNGPSNDRGELLLQIISQNLIFEIARNSFDCAAWHVVLFDQ